MVTRITRKDPASAEIVRPITGTMESIESIPEGAETVFIDFGRRSIDSVDWEGDKRQVMTESLRAMDGLPDNFMCLYVAPAPDPESVLALVVHENYGPEGDPEVWAVAQNFAVAGMEITPRMLIDIALDMEHLNGDGVAAMIREAARMGGKR